VTTSARTKSALAAEAWRGILDLGMRHRGRFVAVLQEFGLTPGDFRALVSLDAEAPRPIGSLAHAWDCDASNATWIVDRLEQRRLVERRQVPADRRVKAIVLTSLGAKTKAQVLDALHQPPVEFTALDRATLEQLRDTLAKVATCEWSPGPGPRVGRPGGAGRRRSARSS